MKKLIAIALLFIAPLAFAQSAMDNPQGYSPTDITSTSARLILNGGTPPISIYRDVNGNWEPVITNWFPPNINSYEFTMSGLNPSTVYNLSLVGGTNNATEGAMRSFTTLAVPDGPFLDVPQNYWAVDQIQWMKDSGITNGCGNGNYCPDDQVTRAQMAVFLYNFWQEFIQ